jgi:hypothetical protein
MVHILDILIEPIFLEIEEDMFDDGKIEILIESE